eukprot:10729702-Lingulodinium_polyedra.AAC.1
MAGSSSSEAEDEATAQDAAPPKTKSSRGPTKNERALRAPTGSTQKPSRSRTCCVCKSSSKNKPWFVTVGNEPDGDFCEQCGVVCDAYVGEHTREEVASKYNDREPDIVTAVNEGRKRLDGKEMPPLVARVVTSRTVSGMVIGLVASFCAMRMRLKHYVESESNRPRFEDLADNTCLQRCGSRPVRANTLAGAL